jgi:hypothetical protein
MNKLAIYTACIGNRSTLEEHTANDVDTDYIAFLNPEPRREMETWDTYGGGLVTNHSFRQEPDWPRLTARCWKSSPHDVFPDHEYWLWIDGSMKLIKSPRDDIEKLMGDADLVGYQHPRRNCIYEELKTCRGDRIETFQARDHLHVLDNCEKKYREEGMPENWGLIENGFLLRRNNTAVMEFNRLWTREIVETSTEDQMVMMYCLWKTGLKWKALEGDATNNKYIEWVGHVGAR